MKLEKRQNGITLIALVVTIIVLLILVGISIAMLTGRNGILSRAGEAKYSNEIAEFDEQTKLEALSTRTSITNNNVSRSGYIATNSANFTELANSVAEGLGVTAVPISSTQTATINTEGYTVGYYLNPEGNDTTDGNGYIVIWYTNNSLRSSMDRDEVTSKYGVTDISTEKSVNQATLVRVIHVENYTSELTEIGLTSVADGNADLKNKTDGSVTSLAKVTSGDDSSSNIIQIKIEKISENSNGVTISVTPIKTETTNVQIPTEEELSTKSQLELQPMFISAYNLFMAVDQKVTWEQIVEWDSVDNIEDAFEAEKEYVPELASYSNVYDLIIQTESYDILTFICNNETITGARATFTLIEDGNYEIIAKNEENNIVATATYNVELPPLTIRVYLKNWQDSFQITLDRNASNQEIMEQIVTTLNEQVGYNVNWVYFLAGTSKTSMQVFSYSASSGYEWNYFGLCPSQLWSLGY